MNKYGMFNKKKIRITHALDLKKKLYNWNDQNKAAKIKKYLFRCSSVKKIVRDLKFGVRLSVMEC